MSEAGAARIVGTPPASAAVRGADRGHPRAATKVVLR